MLWGRLLEDAEFVFNEYSWPAARYGYDALDLFGVFPQKPEWGGVVARLCGARDLKLTPDRAIWTHNGIRDEVGRTAGQALVPDGLVTLWDWRN